MANEEEASPPSISLGGTGSDPHYESDGKMRPVKFSEAAAAKIGYQDELLKSLSGELSFDAEFPTPGDYLSECPDCCYMLRSGSLLRPGSQQHTEYCLNLFVRQENETSLMDNRQGHISELQEILRRTTDTLSGTLIDPSLSTTAVDIADESHGTDEPDIDSPSIQSPHLPHDAIAQHQSIMESERHASMDEPRSHASRCPTCQKDFTHSRPDSFKRHIKEAHVKGDHPCPHSECMKFKKPFKRSDKLQRHLNTCKFELQLRGTKTSS